MSTVAFTDEDWANVDRQPPAKGPEGGLWVNGVPGRRFLIAFEPFTPVLGTFFGDDKKPNFVLPAWYVPGSKGPWDAGGVLSGPQSVTPGGFYVADDEGVVHDVWSHPAGRAAFNAEAANQDSVTAARVSVIEATVKGIPWREHHEARFAPPPAPEKMEGETGAP